MEPDIRYATTPDGVHIGFYATGEGPALLVLPSLPMSHLLVEWQFPPFREFILHLAAGRTLIRYDSRGLGMSDPAPGDFSLDAHVSDAVAVLDRLGVERCDIFAASYAGPIGIALAARHPRRVGHLILWCSHARFGDVAERITPTQLQQRQAVVGLAKVDPSLAVHTYSHHAVGWASEDQAVGFDILALKTVEPRLFFERLDAFAAFDARDLVGQVQSPALVLHRPGFHGSHIDVARGLAAALPQGRLLLLDGTSVAPFIGNSGAVFQAVHTFLGERASPVQARPDSSPATVQALLFTDIEGHSQLVADLGDEAGRRVLREHDRLTREAIRAHRGVEVKALGDGFLARFGSVQRALECAIAIQRSLARAARDPGSELGRAAARGATVRVRVGVNAGEPVAEDQDIFGTVVNAVSRIAMSAAGGQVLVADVVRQLAHGKRFTFIDRGEVDLRGLAEPIRLYELEWQGASSQQP